METNIIMTAFAAGVIFVGAILLYCYIKDKKKDKGKIPFKTGVKNEL